MCGAHIVFFVSPSRSPTVTKVGLNVAVSTPARHTKNTNSHSSCVDASRNKISGGMHLRLNVKLNPIVRWPHSTRFKALLTSFSPPRSYCRGVICRRCLGGRRGTASRPPEPLTHHAATAAAAAGFRWTDKDR